MAHLLGCPSNWSDRVKPSSAGELATHLCKLRASARPVDEACTVHRPLGHDLYKLRGWRPRPGEVCAQTSTTVSSCRENRMLSTATLSFDQKWCLGAFGASRRSGAPERARQCAETLQARPDSGQVAGDQPPHEPRTGGQLSAPPPEGHKRRLRPALMLRASAFRTHEALTLR
jgi:hypothetical protein